MRIYFKTIFLVILFVSTCSVIAGILPDGPYFGQTPPGFTAEVFGPNIVSLPNRRETKIVFSPDGNECFFAAFPTSSSTILYTKQENGHWLDPVEADFLGVSGAKHEPFISPDGQKFLFTNGDIYMSTKVDGQWSAAVKLPSPVNTSEGDWHPSMASDGTLYFTSNREGIFRIYRSELVDGQYTQVEKLDSTINTHFVTVDPFIAPDESYLIFNMRMEDHYISYQSQDGSWTNPQELCINTDSALEYASFVSYDGKYYFFSRPTAWSSTNPSDIYWIDARAILPPYDFERDGSINLEDLEILVSYWLTDEPAVDIAPLEAPDGIVNFLDFIALAENWMYTLPDIIAPPALTGLVAVAGEGVILLDWDDGNEPDMASYNVYRSETLGSGYGKINSLPVTDSNYTDNTVADETLYFYVVTVVDTSGNESEYSNAAGGIIAGAGSIIIQEDPDPNYANGFCGGDGAIFTIYAGSTGSGSYRTVTGVGKGINWSISVPSDGTYTFKWRYSLPSGNRSAKLLINGEDAVSYISFPATGAWTNWQQISQEVSLTAGVKNIRLESLTTSGLANIDYIMITGDAPSTASCP